MDVFQEAGRRPTVAAERPDVAPIHPAVHPKVPGRLTRATRVGLIAPLACLSTLLGLVIGARAADPEVLSSLGTTELLGVAVLILAPGLTLLLMRLDRRYATDTAMPAKSQFTDSSPTIPLGHAPKRVTAHDAHERHAPTPTRAGESLSDTRTHEHISP